MGTTSTPNPFTTQSKSFWMLSTMAWQVIYTFWILTAYLWPLEKKIKKREEAEEGSASQEQLDRLQEKQLKASVFQNC